MYIDPEVLEDMWKSSLYQIEAHIRANERDSQAVLEYYQHTHEPSKWRFFIRLHYYPLLRELMEIRIHDMISNMLVVEHEYSSVSGSFLYKQEFWTAFYMSKFNIGRGGRPLIRYVGEELIVTGT